MKQKILAAPQQRCGKWACCLLPCLGTDEILDEEIDSEDKEDAQVEDVGDPTDIRDGVKNSTLLGICPIISDLPPSALVGD